MYIIYKYMINIVKTDFSYYNDILKYTNLNSFTYIIKCTQILNFVFYNTINKILFRYIILL